VVLTIALKAVVMDSVRDSRAIVCKHGLVPTATPQLHVEAPIVLETDNAHQAEFVLAMLGLWAMTALSLHHAPQIAIPEELATREFAHATQGTTEMDASLSRWDVMH